LIEALKKQAVTATEAGSSKDEWKKKMLEDVKDEAEKKVRSDLLDIAWNEAQWYLMELAAAMDFAMKGKTKETFIEEAKKNRYEGDTRDEADYLAELDETWTEA